MPEREELTTESTEDTEIRIPVAVSSVLSVVSSSRRYRSRYRSPCGKEFVRLFPGASRRRSRAFAPAASFTTEPTAVSSEENLCQT